MREIILDTETTGFSPARGDRIVEIGAIEMVSRVLTGRFFHEYIDPECAIHPRAFDVHGLDDDFLADKPFFEDIADDFLAFIGNSKLVIHNAPFDMRFINAELDMLGFSPIPDARVIDTVALARTRFPGSGVKLDDLCRRFKISNKHRNLHGAMLDAKLLAQVYIKLT